MMSYLHPDNIFCFWEMEQLSKTTSNPDASRMMFCCFWETEQLSKTTSNPDDVWLPMLAALLLLLCVVLCGATSFKNHTREVSKTSQLLTFAHFDTTKPLLAHSTQTQLEWLTQRRRILRSSTWNCISRTNSFKNTASMKHQNPTVLPFFQNYLWKKCIWKTWCP